MKKTEILDKVNEQVHSQELRIQKLENSFENVVEILKELKEVQKELAELKSRVREYVAYSIGGTAVVMILIKILLKL